MYAQNKFKFSPLKSAITFSLLAIGGAISAQEIENSEEVEVIEVVGIKSSLNKSLETKRYSNAVVEAITSEDLGQMPDQNIAESLQRVSGIQIDRNGGEGSVVRIRGLSQNLNTINGERLVSGLGQTSQNSSFEDLPAEMFGEVIVYKTQNASLIEGGIGGVVDLRTRRPFDFEEGDLQFSTTGRLAQGLESGSKTPIASIVASKNWGDIGALLSLSYTEREHLRDGTAFQRGFRTTEVDTSGDGNQDLSYTRARMISAFTNEQERERFGVNAAIQWALNDDLTATAEYFGTYLEILDKTATAQYWADRGVGLITSEPYNISESGYLESGTIEQNFYQTNSTVTGRESDAHNYSLSLDWDSGADLSGSAKLTSARSSLDIEMASADVMPSLGNVVNFEDGTRARVNPNGISTFEYQLDLPLGSEIPTLTSSDSLLDPNYYWYKSQWAEGEDIDSEFLAFRTDFEYSVNVGPLSKVSLGARFANREVTTDDYRYLRQVGNYKYRFNDPQIEAPDLGYTIIPIVNYQDNPDRLMEYDNFFSTSPGNFPSSIFIENLAGMEDPLGWLNSLYPGSDIAKGFLPITSYGVDEDTTAVYLMADFTGDFRDYFYDLNAGFRYIQTEVTIASNDVPTTRADGSPNSNSTAEWNGTPLEWSQLETEKDYNDFLPSITLTLHLSNDLLLKSGFNETMARPNLAQLGKGFSKSYSGEFENGGPDGQFQRFASGNAGNPELAPDRARAYDISLEWYTSEGSALVAALFYKDIESFTIAQQNIEPIPDSDGVVRDGGLVSSFVNGNGGFVRGYEVAAQHAFENGFGFVANFTYSDSENEDFKNPVTSDSLAIPGISDKSYNLIGYYEKDEVRFRLAYNWRSERLGGLFSGFPRYTRDFGQLDASLRYSFTDKLGISLEGINLTGSDNSNYLDVGDGKYFFDWGTDETRFMLSATYKM